MKIIGLTGGIGSGKSTAAQFLKEFGAVVIDLDKVGHFVLQKNGGAYQQVVNAFGTGILNPDGEIDRAKLGNIVFSNPEDLKRLNKIVHPLIDKTVEKVTRESRSHGLNVVVLEAAAMLEADRSWQVDEIWVIAATEHYVIPRIKDRPDYTEEVVRKRIKAQLPNEERRKKADVYILNDGALSELKIKLKDEWDKLQKRL